MKKDITTMIADLKHSLQHSEKLSDVANAFYDLTDIEEFLSDGEPGSNEIFATFLKQGIESWSGREIEKLESNCVVMAKYHLCHGPAFVGDSAINLFVFDDIQLGLMILFDGETEETRFMRISANKVEAPAFPVDHGATD